MITKTVKVNNPTGLHARPAAQFIQQAKQFASKLTVIKDGASFNGKSMISLMSAGITCGTEIELVTEGADEAAAMDAMVAAIAAGLGEAV